MAQRANRQTFKCARKSNHHDSGRQGRSRESSLWDAVDIRRAQIVAKQASDFPLCTFVPFVVNLFLRMNKKIFLVCAGVVLATIAVFANAPQDAPGTSQPDKTAEAARLNNLGAAYMNQQLFEKALKAFEDAAALDPKFQIAQMNQGIALLNLGRVDSARLFLENAVKQNPNDPHGWYNLGMLEKNSGNPQAAAEAFRRATEIDPNDADTWYFLGASYAQSKQYPEAIYAFQHALKLNPLHASAEFGLSRAYQQSADLTH